MALRGVGFEARKRATIQRRAERASAAVQAISWKAQERLCGRFQRLRARGVSPPKTVTATGEREAKRLVFGLETRATGVAVEMSMSEILQEHISPRRNLEPG